MLENKSWIRPYQFGAQSRLFVQLPNRSLRFRLPGIEMPLGQIPTIVVSHQQELNVHAATENQVAA
jgi:hypothetical protein